ncbi:hypothetical protein MTR67_007544 [Solanum verrucosum]|uniref:Chromo domain-containing protein n=1 Tax=Solanum verrucosum TaxID=315347 RepID=A0AAF0PZV1_SOLVR|nr:hypothetical protein MTR67_007544 [Solanum verrucosum]
MSKKYHGDEDYIIKWDSILLEKGLQYEEEPVAILDHDGRKLRNKEIKSMKVQWKHRLIEEGTWETEKDMRSKCVVKWELETQIPSFCLHASCQGGINPSMAEPLWRDELCRAGQSRNKSGKNSNFVIFCKTSFLRAKGRAMAILDIFP